MDSDAEVEEGGSGWKRQFLIAAEAVNDEKNRSRSGDNLPLEFQMNTDVFQ